MLSDLLEFKVRFNEVDPLGITWHGNYISYFEDGREAFGAKHDLRYLDIYKHGFVAPIVSVHCDYKKSLSYGEIAILETTFVNTPAAKIIFTYKIFLPHSKQIVAEGKTVQVFLDKDQRQLQLSTPYFFEQWKKEKGLVNGF